MSRNQVFIIVGVGLFALCAAGALVAGIFFLVLRSAEQTEPVAQPIAQVVSIAPHPRPEANGNSMGDPNAPIKIEVFSDFQCPYCQSFHEETEPLLVEQYISTGKVHFTYRSMGNFVSENIDAENTESQDAAMAAYCAMDQDQFWAVHDMLFANVLGENARSFTDERNKAIANATGLDMDQFNKCYDSQKYAATVEKDREDAQTANVMGVPSFLLTYTVNAETKTSLIEGAQPFSQFQEELEAVLSEIGT